MHTACSGPIEARCTRRLTWRSELASRFRSLDHAEYTALRDLTAGAPFAAICERVTPEQAGSWLRSWISEELLSGAITGVGPRPATDT